MEEDSSKIKLIPYNKQEIKEKIKTSGKYESGSTVIIKWEDEMNPNSEMYIVKNKFKNIPFMGVVNHEFKREGYCINNYTNGDEYFGYYRNDVRNNQGIYLYKPKKINNKLMILHYYFGLWENDIKHGRGIYLWLKENSSNNNLLHNKLYNPFTNFDTSNFSAFIGKMDKNTFQKGTLLKKEGDEYFVFHGFLDSKNLKKSGKDCFYYSAKLEEIFYGTFKNDIFTDGYVGKFDEEGEIKNIVKYSNKKIIESEKLSKFDNIKSVTKKLTTFRNVIMSKDYFGILFDVFKDIINFKNNEMKDINIFNSEKYIDLMEIFATHNKVSIFKDIEKYLNQ